MIRIELDRLHLELLLLAGLLAAFAGVVFEPTMRYGLNVTPLVALGVVGALGILVLVHRRFTSGDHNRIRAMLWFALTGALLGATVSSAVSNTVRSMVLAALGVGGMFFAIGTQFSIVIKDREVAAREALESILDEENVFAAQTNGADTNDQPTDLGPTASPSPGNRTDASPGGLSERETDDDMTEWGAKTDGSGADTVDSTDRADRRGTENDGDRDDRREANSDGDRAGSRGTENDAESRGTENDADRADREADSDVEQTDAPGSESWSQSVSDDTDAIPFIRSITSNDSSEE